MGCARQGRDPLANRRDTWGPRAGLGISAATVGWQSSGNGDGAWCPVCHRVVGRVTDLLFTCTAVGQCPVQGHRVLGAGTALPLQCHPCCVTSLLSQHSSLLTHPGNSRCLPTPHHRRQHHPGLAQPQAGIVGSLQPVFGGGGNGRTHMSTSDWPLPSPEWPCKARSCNPGSTELLAIAITPPGIAASLPPPCSPNPE